MASVGRLRLAVADDAGDDQIRVVEGGPIRVDQRIAQLSAFMNRARSLGRDVTRNSVRPRELAKEPLQSVAAALDRRIVLGVRPFQIALRHDARPAMAGTDDVHHVEIVLLDQPVEMDIEKVQPRGRAPMPQQTRLDVFEPERGFEQRIVLQIDLPDRQVVGGAPVGVHLLCGDAVLVGGPDRAVAAQERGARALFAAEAERAVEQAGGEPLEADGHLEHRRP